MPDIWEGKFTRDISRNPLNIYSCDTSKIYSSQLLRPRSRVDDIYSLDLLAAQNETAQHMGFRYGQGGRSVGLPASNHASAKGQLKCSSRVTHK